MLITVIGGSGSGKSEYAENRAVAVNSGDLYYVATMEPFDKESLMRIDRHRAMRSHKNFRTIECPRHLAQATVTNQATVLLECMSNLVANEMFSESGAGEDTFLQVTQGLLHLMSQAQHVVVVTNNIFEDGFQYDPGTLSYMETLGKINRWLGERSGQVVEVVHGIPVFLRGSE